MREVFETDVIALRKIMAEQKIFTVKKFAEVCDIDRNIAGGILNSNAQPSSDTMFKIVAGLRIPPENAGLIFFKPKLTQ